VSLVGFNPSLSPRREASARSAQSRSATTRSRWSASWALAGSGTCQRDEAANRAERYRIQKGEMRRAARRRS